MAKSFNKLKDGLGLLDYITVGKYKNCRVDSIIEEDDAYLRYMDSIGALKFTPEVIEKLKLKFSGESIECYDEPDDDLEDIPY